MPRSASWRKLFARSSGVLCGRCGMSRNCEGLDLRGTYEHTLDADLCGPSCRPRRHLHSSTGPCIPGRGWGLESVHHMVRVVASVPRERVRRGDLHPSSAPVLRVRDVERCAPELKAGVTVMAEANSPGEPLTFWSTGTDRSHTHFAVFPCEGFPF